MIIQHLTHCVILLSVLVTKKSLNPQNTLQPLKTQCTPSDAMLESRLACVVRNPHVFWMPDDGTQHTRAVVLKLRGYQIAPGESHRNSRTLFKKKFYLYVWIVNIWIMMYIKMININKLNQLYTAY